MCLAAKRPGQAIVGLCVYSMPAMHAVILCTTLKYTDAHDHVVTQYADSTCSCFGQYVNRVQ